MTDREHDALFRRLVTALETLAGIPAPVVEAKVPAGNVTAKDMVSLIRRTRQPEPELDDRGLTSGGTIPEEFWSRPDPDKGRMARTKRLPMGRPL